MLLANVSQPSKCLLQVGIAAQLSMGCTQGLPSPAVTPHPALLLDETRAALAFVRGGGEGEMALAEAGVFIIKISPIKGNPVC